MSALSSIVLAGLGTNASNFMMITVILLVLVAVLSFGMRSRLTKEDTKRGAYGVVATICIIGLIFTGLVYAVFAAGLMPG
jgi:hypothetical protein